MSGPFHTPAGRRLGFEEIVKVVRSERNLELVGGFSRVVECRGGARAVTGYPQSFVMATDPAWRVEQQPGQELSWLTDPVPKTEAGKVGFVFAMAMGMGSTFDRVSGAFQFTVERQGEEVAQFLLPVVKSRQWRRDDGAILAYAPRRVEVATPGSSLALDAEVTEDSAVSFGIGLIVVDQELLANEEPMQISVSPYGRSSRRWFRLEASKRYEDWNLPVVLDMIDAKPGGVTSAGQKVFFGDIHVHSGETGGSGHGCGQGSVVDNYEYARRAARLDFFALTDHDWDIQNEEGWQIRREAAAEWDSPGRFATLLGFEWTAVQYGHRNVYYRGLEGGWTRAITGGGKFDESNATPRDLYAMLRQQGTAAITIPHHPAYGYHPMAWDTLDPEFDRLVEIYSCWGSSEYAESPYANIGSDTFEDLFVDKALQAGHRFGIIASSDGHDGCPGFGTWPGPESLQLHPHLRHPLGSGRAAVFSERLCREAVFDGLAERECYGTTGEDILLTFALERHPMGSELAGDKLGGRPTLQLWTRGTLGMNKLQIIKNGRLLVSVDARRAEEDLQVVDEQFDPDRPNFYYAKVIQRDHEMAWSSPIFAAPR